DGLARTQPGQDLGRRMTHALVLDVDDVAGVCLERVARVEIGQTIRLNDLPVRPVVEHASADRWSFERAADDGDNPAPAASDLAQFDGLAQLDVGLEGKRERGRRRSGRVLSRTG